jgi:hypothetical protein
MRDYELLHRFELRDGQFFAEYRYSNLHWFLNDKEFGYGDLREEDIKRIAARLYVGEQFIGWHEHHGSRFQQTNTPVIRIKSDGVVMFREDIIQAEGR